MSAGPQIHRGPEWEAPWRDPAGGQDTVRGRSRLLPLGGPRTRLPWARLGAAARSWQEDLPSSPSPGDAAPARASHSEHHCSWKCQKRRLSGMTPQSGSHLPSLLSGAAGLAPTAECVPRSADGRRKGRMNRVHLQEGPQLCFAVRFIPVGACPLGMEGGLGGRGPAQSRRAFGSTSCWEFQGAFCGMPGLAVPSAPSPGWAQALAGRKPVPAHRQAWQLRPLCRAYPVEQYPCRTKATAAIMHMIMNNLDPAVAQVRARRRGPGTSSGNGMGEAHEMLSSFLFRNNDRFEGNREDRAERTSSPSPGCPQQLHLR